MYSGTFDLWTMSMSFATDGGAQTLAVNMEFTSAAAARAHIEDHALQSGKAIRTPKISGRNIRYVCAAKGQEPPPVAVLGGWIPEKCRVMNIIILCTWTNQRTIKLY